MSITLRPNKWKNFRHAGQNCFFFIATPHRPQRFCSERESAWPDLFSRIAFIDASGLWHWHNATRLFRTYIVLHTTIAVIDRRKRISPESSAPRGMSNLLRQNWPSWQEYPKLYRPTIIRKCEYIIFKRFHWRVPGARKRYGHAIQGLPK